MPNFCLLSALTAVFLLYHKNCSSTDITAVNELLKREIAKETSHQPTPTYTKLILLRTTIDILAGATIDVNKLPDELQSLFHVDLSKATNPSLVDIIRERLWLADQAYSEHLPASNNTSKLLSHTKWLLGILTFFIDYQLQFKEEIIQEGTEMRSPAPKSNPSSYLNPFSYFGKSPISHIQMLVEVEGMDNQIKILKKLFDSLYENFYHATDLYKQHCADLRPNVNLEGFGLNPIPKDLRNDAHLKDTHLHGAKPFQLQILMKVVIEAIKIGENKVTVILSVFEDTTGMHDFGDTLELAIIHQYFHDQVKEFGGAFIKKWADAEWAFAVVGEVLEEYKKIEDLLVELAEKEKHLMEELNGEHEKIVGLHKVVEGILKVLYEQGSMMHVNIPNKLAAREATDGKRTLKTISVRQLASQEAKHISDHFFSANRKL